MSSTRAQNFWHDLSPQQQRAVTRVMRQYDITLPEVEAWIDYGLLTWVRDARGWQLKDTQD